MKSLEEYLKELFDKQINASMLKLSHIDENGQPHIYIHPHGVSGETLDFIVKENEIVPKR
jgi:hypothetical protein